MLSFRVYNHVCMCVSCRKRNYVIVYMILVVLQSELFDAQPEGDVSLYELYATVVHIDNHRTCGNVVANVNVGGPYHKRKQAKG